MRFQNNSFIEVVNAQFCWEPQAASAGCALPELKDTGFRIFVEFKSLCVLELKEKPVITGLKMDDKMDMVIYIHNPR